MKYIEAARTLVWVVMCVWLCSVVTMSPHPPIFLLYLFYLQVMKIVGPLEKAHGENSDLVVAQIQHTQMRQVVKHSGRYLADLVAAPAFINNEKIHKNS